MSWTQPVCEERFRSIYPDREPVRMVLEREEMDPCCFCKRPTNIFIRLDPATVPYPMEK